ncbi:LolA family protein [Rhodohalobacter sp. 8-1]|uniref:LolA family protein n=1 Tax=Rhodohalobacter sp. 8-1 TaxID=3131972 RepID=UPI0030EB9435
MACKTLAFSVITALLLSVQPQTISAQDTQVFDRLKSMFEQGMIFRADFTHRYEDSFTGETQQNEGRIWIGRDQYKIEGNNQVMVVDGDISRVYDATKNRVIISDYVEEEDDFAPSRMLQGVDTSYSISESAISGNRTEITLESDDPFTVFQTVTITLNSNGLPTVIQATDQANNQLTTRFEDGEFVEPDENLFELNEPQSAEIIDLRYTDS